MSGLDIQQVTKTAGSAPRHLLLMPYMSSHT